VCQAIVAFLLAGQLLVADVRFDGVDRTDVIERLGHCARLGILGFKHLTSRVGPALGVGQSGLLGVVRVGAVAVSTAGGLTSGIDLALHVGERYFGRRVAEQTATALEYQG